MIRLLALATIVLSVASGAVLLATSPASAACVLSHCKKDAPTRSYITNTHRQIVGDLYDPGHGRRTQIRNSSRQILFYIERSGRITNPSRQPVANIEELMR